MDKSGGCIVPNLQEQETYQSTGGSLTSRRKPGIVSSDAEISWTTGRLRRMMGGRLLKLFLLHLYNLERRQVSTYGFINQAPVQALMYANQTQDAMFQTPSRPANLRETVCPLPPPAVFDIFKVVENDVEVDLGLIRHYHLIMSGAGLDSHNSGHPKPFKCSIKLRSAKAAALIKQNVNNQACARR
ncbi:hypothetical protein BDR06DRAFT_999974 [Suillus hirtellus]|nr:hypothetical protein BDR06DRAFT_999974 [Suillus hirtellus]